MKTRLLSLFLALAIMQTTLVVPLVSEPSDTLPFSASLVYNSGLNGCYFSGYYKDVHTADFNTMKVGIGWKLSLQETVVSLPSGALVYTDGDGTEHYYVYSGSDNGYIEEGENTRLKITGSGAQYTLSDEYVNKKIFSYGYLTEVRDAYGNALYYCYDGKTYASGNWKPSSSGSHKITSVYRKNKDCSAEQILLLGYNGDFLSTIIPKCNYDSSDSKDARRITLLRESVGTNYTNLTGIEYPGGRTAQYTYFGINDSFWRRNKLLRAYDAEANYGIEFSYNYNGKTENIYEYINEGSDRVYGAKLHGYKRSHLLAVYRDYGRDQTANTSDDYLTFKVFNRMGRTISAYTTDSTERRVLGSSAASYTVDTQHRKANNLLAASAYTAQSGVKLMRNGGAEYGGAYWNSAAVTATNEAYRGVCSFRINGDELYQLFHLYPGKTYTFSGYIKINGTAASGGGVSLAFQESISATEVRDIMNSPYIQTTTQAIDDGWQRVSLTYAPPREIVVRTAVLSKDLGSATAYGDCFRFEESETASSYNLLNCGSFEESDSIEAYKENQKVCGWYYAGNASLSGNAGNGGVLFGNQVLRVDSSNGSHRASQSFTFNAPAGSAFLLSGWGKADALPGSVAEMSNKTEPYFGLIARLYYGDTTEKSEVFYLPFDAYSGDWQQRSGILMFSEAHKDKKIIKITIVASYDNNINTAYFDNISLRMEPTQTYRYDENGNPVAATQPKSGTESATYSGIDLTSYTAASGTKYTYTYNSAHDVTSAKVGGLTATTTYNANGNVIGSELHAEGNALSIKSSATVTDDKNHTASVTDANGSTTRYTYDAYTGLVNSITNAKNQSTNYTYDPATLRSKNTYRDGIANIGYSYTNGRLTTLDRKTFRSGTEQHQYYYFAYNDWGQPTTTKVGNRTLSTNTYYGYDGETVGTGGNLKTTTYGNGASVSYTYDKLDRLTKKVYTDGRYVTYTYNAESQLTKLTYGTGNSETASYLFEYDSLGRLVRSSEADGSGTVGQRTEHIYDEHNRLKRQSWTLGSKSYTESYTYNDGTNETGNLSTMTTGTGNVLSYAYDTLKRLQKVSVKSGSGTLFSTAYSYQNISDTQTTPRVRFRNVRVGDSGTLLEGKRYEYDALGNITRISQSVSPYYPLVEYSYDSQNQLIKETYYDGSGTGTAHVTDYYDYTYDTAGNLLTAAKNGTVTQTYSYGNSDWRDLLTAVNGNGITYDNGGNPLRYGGWNFDWQNGRELAKAELSDGATDTTLTYAYDADGIRTSKTYKVETYEAHYTVKFVADGVTVKTMTVTDGYTLKDSDYPTVPAKSGYTGSWQKYTAAIHSNITVQATYSALAQYTVKFVADGVTVKTMTVYEGYVLKSSDYPAVPEKEGYNGAWSSYTSAIHENITISAAYLPNRLSQYTVTFKHLNKTVSILKVNDGQILRSKDYPTPPTGCGWIRNTNPIHANTTIHTTPGTGKHLVEFEGNLTLAKIMAVADGYKLKDSDYPAVPAKSGYTGTWTKYTDAIYEDITVTATYKKSETIKPPTRPTSVVASEDLPEPIEPQDVREPDDTVITDTTVSATGNIAETQASHPGQTLVSTQTVTHEYLTLSGKVARETVTKNGNVTDVMDFVYDESGRPFAMIHQAGSASNTLTTYYYVLNLQGDIVKLVTSSGSVVATYEYDAWGNILSKSGSMADKNPLRYRGYYYDSETGFYYLQSRYYDPTTRRFVNADCYESTGQGFIGTNMFAYCNNCPVNCFDPTGRVTSPTDDFDGNGIPDYLDKRWRDLTATVKMMWSLQDMGFEDCSFSSARQCLKALGMAQITTPEQKAHFFSQCYVESCFSLLEAGYLDYDTAENYRKQQAYYPYYGAGHLQLTWDYNYKAFADYMGDPRIYTDGPQYVAKNYAWLSAGWVWVNNGINNIIATDGSVYAVTRSINGGLSGFDDRMSRYLSYIQYWEGR